jgi:hypothetical protein
MSIKELWPLGGLLVAALAFGGCHSGGTVTGPKDAQVYDLALDLPPGCPPASGNEKGVGIICTKGGGECTKPGVPGGLLCTCDPAFGLQLNGVPCVCTIAGPNLSATVSDPCSAAANGKPAGFCGTDATCCPYMTVGYYCSPNICLPGGSCINFTAADSGT